MADMKLVTLDDKQNEQARWPIDCILPRLEEFSEILIIGKTKGRIGFLRFSSRLQNTFEWIGFLEEVKRALQNENIVREE